MKSVKTLIIKGLRPIYWLCINLFSYTLSLFLFAMKPIKFVKLVVIRSDRIGHLAANTDFFLRQSQLKDVQKEKRILNIGISGPPCNRQLLKMFKRKFRIIEVGNGLYEFFIRAIRNKTKFLHNTYTLFRPNAYYEFNNTDVNISFTPEEEQKGKALLKKMGIPSDAWFVCFQARDPLYLAKHVKKDSNYHDFRDCEIKNYLKAAEYITSRGGYAIRMGYRVAEKLSGLNNPKIIDYASKHRTDFGDIYLSAKCKFFLGSSAGLFCVPYIFHVPAIMANYIPMSVASSPRKRDMHLPTKIWSITKKRFLTFREIVDLGVDNYLYSKQYADAGLKPVENTSEEILDVAREMNERLDGIWKTTKKDEKLHAQFYSVFKPQHQNYGSPVRIGTKFLRKNKALLE